MALTRITINTKYLLAEDNNSTDYVELNHIVAITKDKHGITLRLANGKSFCYLMADSGWIGYIFAFLVKAKNEGVAEKTFPVDNSFRYEEQKRRMENETAKIKND